MLKSIPIRPTGDYKGFLKDINEGNSRFCLLGFQFNLCIDHRILNTGNRTYNGSLKLRLNEIPFDDDFMFKRYGRYYFAKTDGLVELYEHQPGTKSGFAGRVKTLRFDDGSIETFEGSLWDPFGLPDNLPEFRSISMTAEEEVMERGHTFYSGKIMREIYDQLCNYLDVDASVKQWIL